MREGLREAWETNNRINLFLIDNISDEGLRCTLSRRGGPGIASDDRGAGKPAFLVIRRPRG